MPVVETFCEDINILEKGKITLSGNLDYIKKTIRTWKNDLEC